ncbi:MAG: hypothetical protein HYZ26_06175 [Chloroflexi bacterium]|nr:hypothetical protein [Chloroflexota bacterium]
MTTKNKTLTVVLAAALLAASLFSIFSSRAAAASLPQTGALSAPVAAAPLAKGSLKATKVEVPGVFVYTVEQSGNGVPSAAGSVGQYAEAAKKKSLGFLAHNYLAGASFAALSPGQLVIVTFSDGSTQTYEIYNVLTFQASNPDDFSKPFINSSGKRLTARQVFSAAYKANEVTFQTCIAKDGSSSWGLIFVQAKLVK